MANKRLTDLTIASAITNDSLIHIVNTGDTIQYSGGSSYKTSLGEVLNLYAFTGNTSATCITNLYVDNLYGCSPITVYSSLVSYSAPASTAIGTGAIAFGDGVSATGQFSQAMGAATVASGNYSYASGFQSNTLQNYSRAHGAYTIANGQYQHVVGKYNISDSTSGAFIIGNGSSNISRSTLLFAAGNQVEISGKTKTATLQVTSGATSGYVLTSDIDGNGTWQSPSTFTGNSSANCITNLYVDNLFGCSPITFNSSIQSISSTSLFGSGATGNESIAFGSGVNSLGNHSFTLGTYLNSLNQYSFSLGSTNTSWGQGSSSMGWQNSSGWKPFACTITNGTVMISQNGDYTTSDFSSFPGYVVTENGVYQYHPSLAPYYNGSNTYIYLTDSGATGTFVADFDYLPYGFSSSNGGYSGNYSHTQGYNNRAVADYSHSEGYETVSTKPYSHSEGFKTRALGNGSHAEGRQSKSLGYYSHAEGYDTKSLGVASHSEGVGTTAEGDFQHVSGMYNNTGDTTTGAFIIGNGFDESNRSNLLHAAGTVVNISGKTITTNLQVTSGASDGYILTSDSNGNGTWEPIVDNFYTEPSNTGFTWDVSGNSTNYSITLTANTTLDLINVRNGDYGTIIVKQDGTGGFGLTLNNVNGSTGSHKVVNGGGGLVTLSSGPNNIDILSFVYDGTNMYWNIGLNYT